MHQTVPSFTDQYKHLAHGTLAVAAPRRRRQREGSQLSPAPAETRHGAQGAREVYTQEHMRELQPILHTNVLEIVAVLLAFLACEQVNGLNRPRALVSMVDMRLPRHTGVL